MLEEAKLYVNELGRSLGDIVEGYFEYRDPGATRPGLPRRINGHQVGNCSKRNNLVLPST